MIDKNDTNSAKLNSDDRIRYVTKLYDFLYPDEEPCNGWWLIEFPMRYNKGDIVFNKTIADYYKDIDLQERILTLGIDKERFWYFILFLYDISETKSQGYYSCPESKEDQLDNFQEKLDAIFEFDDDGSIKKYNHNEIKIEDDVKIELRINNKKKATIDNKIAIYWMKVMMSDFLDRYKRAINIKNQINQEEDTDKCIELGKDPDFRVCYTRIFGENIFDREKLDISNHYRNYLIIDYLKSFFKCFKGEIKKGKSGENLFDKEYFIGEVLKFMGLLDSEYVDKEYIKNTYKYYQNYEIQGISFDSMIYV